MQTINTRELLKVLQAALRVNKSVFVSGSVGIGKSEVIKFVASKMLDNAIEEAQGDYGLISYYESLRGNNVVDIRLATETPATIKGVTIPEKGENGWKSEIAFNKRYPRDPRWVGIIFFDEVSSAPPNNQVYAYQALNDHCVDTLKFPKGALVVAAGNRVGDGGIVYELPSPIMNRVRHFELAPDGKIWVEDYGIPNNIHPSILSLISSVPELIDTSDTRVKGQNTSFATARSWTDASESVYDYEEGIIDMPLLMRTLEGTIGEKATAEWRINYDIGVTMPSTHDILEGHKPQLGEETSKSIASYYIAFNCMTSIRSFIHKGVGTQELVKYFENMTEYFLDVLNMDVSDRDLLSSIVMSYEELFKKEEYSKRYPMFVENHLLKTPSFRKTMHVVRQIREAVERNGVK